MQLIPIIQARIQRLADEETRLKQHIREEMANLRERLPVLSQSEKSNHMQRIRDIYAELNNVTTRLNMAISEVNVAVAAIERAGINLQEVNAIADVERAGINFEPSLFSIIRDALWEFTDRFVFPDDYELGKKRKSKRKSKKINY